jgi:hypothetical protein
LLGDPVPAKANDDNAIRSAAANEKVLIMVCLLRLERGPMRMRLACSIRVPQYFDAVHSAAEPKSNPKDHRAGRNIGRQTPDRLGNLLRKRC